MTLKELVSEVQHARHLASIRNKHLVILSVEHTGTHTLQMIIDTKYVFHTIANVEAHPGIDTALIFVPLRCPRKTWESWAKRMALTFSQTSYDEAARKFIEQWKLLDELRIKFAPFFIPIDQLTNSHKFIYNSKTKTTGGRQKIAQYPWREEFNEIYDYSFIKELYA